MEAGYPSVIATATGILGAAWWAGNTASMSIFTIPVLIDACKEPSQALRLWEALYIRGKATGPKVSLVICLSLAYAAYDCRSRGLEWRPYLAAGALTMAIVPWTLGVMMPTNNALIAGIAGTRGAGKAMGLDEVKVLLARWGTLNFIRGIFPLAGAALGLWQFVKI